MNILTTVVLWTSLHSQVLGVLKDWQCSSPDKDGLVHFPDFPVDITQIIGAEVVTHTKAFNIFSVTPNCSGTIIGADFCYALTNETDTEQRQVFQLVKLDQLGDTFSPNPNYTDLIFTALPIDRTQCTQQESGRTVCCQRNTVSKRMRLDGVLNFGIVAQNYDNVDYPLLMFKVSTKNQLIQSYRVDFGRLSFPDDVFSNVYDSYNTIRTASNSPVINLLIEPDKNSTLLLLGEEASSAPDLLTVIWCLVCVTILEGLALAVCVAHMIITTVKWRRLKKTQQLKCRQYKKTPSIEGILPAGPANSQDISYQSIESNLPVPTNHQSISYEPPTFIPPIPMRVMYDNSISSQPNSSYTMEPLPTQEPDELDYDDIDISI